MTVPLLLSMAADAHPDRVAVGGPRPLTFSELQSASSRLATRLRHGAVNSVAFIGVSGPAWPVLVFGCLAAGATLSPLNYRLPASQLGDLLTRLDRPTVVTDERYLPIARGRGLATISTAELLERDGRSVGTRPVEDRPAEIQPTDAAVLLFTSGTTSRPKGVVLRHEHLFTYTVHTVEFAAASPDDCALVCVPPYHVAGVGTVLTNTYAGRRILFLGDFEPRSWLELVRRGGVTQAMVVPTMLARIVDELGGKVADVPTLRSIAYGGAAISPATLHSALKAFPQVGFTNAYGLTETSSTIAVLGPDDHRAAMRSTDEPTRRRLFSVGRAVPGVELRVVNGAGEQMPSNVVGNLQARGPQISGEYAETGPVLTADGWFATRDLASLDDDGYLFIHGRADDTIIRGGENIAPAEIESVLLQHEAVIDAAVIGEADDEWGQRTVAHVVVAPGTTLSPSELRDWVRERARSSKTPDVVRIVPSLPYNAMGKLVRHELIARTATKEDP